MGGETSWYFCMSKFVKFSKNFHFLQKFKPDYLVIPWLENYEMQLVRFVLMRRIEWWQFHVSRFNIWRDNPVWSFCKKMKISNNFANFDMQKCQGVSPSIDHRDTCYSSLDSSRRGASNGRQFMSLAPLDGKIFAFCCFETFANNSLSIDPKDMVRPPFDSSRQDESNELRFIIF